MLPQSIENFTCYLQNIKNASNHTIRNYGIDLSSFLQFFCEKEVKISVSEIARRDIQEYLAWLHDKRLNKRSVARKISTLRSFFKYLISIKKIATSPLEAIEGPKIEKPLPSSVTYELVQQFLNQPDLSCYLGFRDRTMMELFYSSGLRLSEVAGLNRADICFDELTVKVRGKGKKERVIPITKNAAFWIQSYLNHAERNMKTDVHAPQIDDFAIFLNKHGYRISPRSIDRRFNEHLNKSGLAGKITPHTLRHSIATHWLEKGMGIKTIQLILGHSSPTTTTIYTQVSNSLKQKVYDETHPRAH